MSFCTLEFILFFAAVFILYFKIPKKYQWVLMLVSSYYFYMCWRAEFIILIIASTVMNYFFAICIERTTSDSKKKIWLAFSLSSNLLLLFYFKYTNFFVENINILFHTLSLHYSIPAFDIILPIGISFYTFQTMSYIMDVYRGTVKAERHFGYFALFVTYFPQLVAGPIEKAQNLLPQLKAEHEFSYENAVYGTKLMVWGFFKKLIVADTLAIYVDLVYNDLCSVTSGLTLMIATFFFAIQIYCDFSGYSDIARGCARIMGIELMVNFKSPLFFSKSTKEYWRRHHISLTNWFREYVYIPLGGNRKGLVRKYLNNTATFLLSGLWHGADWTYVIWGGLQSIYLNAGDFLRRKLRRGHIVEIPNRVMQNFASTIVTCCLSCFAWIFFRAENLQDALFIIRNLFMGIGQPLEYVLNGLYYFDLADKAIPLLILYLFDWVNEKHDAIQRMEILPGRGRKAFYLAFVFYFILKKPSILTNTFIYFQF